MTRAAEDPVRRHRLTVAQYRRMGEEGILDPDARVELIEGEIIDMAPTGSRHAGIVRHLADAIGRAVGALGMVSVQSPIALNESSEPQPDVAVLRPRADYYKSGHPRAEDVLLIVEVAESSLRYDRQIKLPLYARHRITEVWIAEVESGELFRYRSPIGDRYAEAGAVDRLSSVEITALPGIRLDLGALFDTRTSS